MKKILLGDDGEHLPGVVKESDENKVIAILASFAFHSCHSVISWDRKFTLKFII